MLHGTPNICGGIAFGAARDRRQRKKSISLMQD